MTQDQENRPVSDPDFVPVDDDRLVRHPLGFLQIADIPSADELKAFYEERYYQTGQGSYRASYDSEELRYLDHVIERKAHAVTQVRGDGLGTMLDVGCGEGFALAWFARQGWTVEGLDHSSAGVTAMNPEMAPRVDFGDVFVLLDERIREGRSYDLVWMTNVLEHVVDPVALLRQLGDLVAPGGVLMITVPNDSSAFQEMLLERGHIPERFWVAPPDHLNYFNRDSLEATVAATGWHCRDISADFPIDLFLLHEGSNYVRDRDKGLAAHRARIQMELLLALRPVDEVNDYCRAMARVGLGRTLTAVLARAA
jgi:2-polyprenyl-3-methyl-5-hydroxy-6-metoxy-1,4-benzoquinol methylase